MVSSWGWFNFFIISSACILWLFLQFDSPTVSPLSCIVMICCSSHKVSLSVPHVSAREVIGAPMWLSALFERNVLLHYVLQILLMTIHCNCLTSDHSLDFLLLTLTSFAWQEFLGYWNIVGWSSSYAMLILLSVVKLLAWTALESLSRDLVWIKTCITFFLFLFAQHLIVLKWSITISFRLCEYHHFFYGSCEQLPFSIIELVI